MHNIFRHHKLPSGFKHNLITLIPKSKHDTNIYDFRPISLCNTFYKVFAKVITNRLKNILLCIINGAQSTFIKGRDTLQESFILLVPISGGRMPPEIFVMIYGGCHHR